MEPRDPTQAAFSHPSGCRRGDTSRDQQGCAQGLALRRKILEDEEQEPGWVAGTQARAAGSCAELRTGLALMNTGKAGGVKENCRVTIV